MDIFVFIVAYFPFKFVYCFNILYNYASISTILPYILQIQ